MALGSHRQRASAKQVDPKELLAGLVPCQEGDSLSSGTTTLLCQSFDEVKSLVANILGSGDEGRYSSQSSSSDQSMSREVTGQDEGDKTQLAVQRKNPKKKVFQEPEAQNHLCEYCDKVVGYIFTYFF